MQHFITIEGVELPPPKRGLNLKIATIVDSARNANGEVIGQKVGRDQQKIDNLEWAYLDGDTWRQILQIFDQKFFVTVTYPNMVTGTWTTRKMYPGDRSATPMWLNMNSGLPTHYINCKVNLIDAGK